MGSGVCGVVAETKEYKIVQDVRVEENYIACDDITESELVMPVMIGDRLYAVLDIDADVKDYWEDVDVEWLARFAALVCE